MLCNACTRMSKYEARNHKDSVSGNTNSPTDDTRAVMALTLEYFNKMEETSLVRISDIVPKIEVQNQQRLYLRWLLSRDKRVCVVDVCKILLQLDKTVTLVVKDEIESELIVHVAVDLLQELLKAGLEFPQFIHCPSMTSPVTSYRNDNPVEAIWDCMIFRSLLYGKSGLRYERRPDPSEKFAYVLIVSMIQACNFETNCLEALANVIYKYPIHPIDVYTYGKVFRALVLAGVGPSDNFVREMEGKEAGSKPDYYEPYRKWYTDYRRQVPSLRQCTRLAVRRSVNVNMEVAVSLLEVPRDLTDFLLLRDQQTLSVINVDDTE